MATTCLPLKRCGTVYPGWMNGSHPTVAEGKVIRKVWFTKESCYGDWWIIQVKNCGPFYIYKFSGTPGCDMRFCGAD